MLEFEEKRFGKRSKNQYYYRSSESKDRCIDIKKSIYINSNGKAKIVFDVMNLDKFSIAISNLSKEDVFLQTRVSPDGIFYKNVNGKRIVKENTIEFCRVEFIARFVKLHIEGTPCGEVQVYLQGRRIS
ncbi:MAG: hypothetical protein K0R71_331 [Bacillales bacterium]|jgi:hypothetical protein|nr:hypothetical protein [Bacillales bacterium]